MKYFVPTRLEQTECSETLAIKLHTPENNPKKIYDIKKKRNSEINKRTIDQLFIILFLIALPLHFSKPQRHLQGASSQYLLSFVRI
jgi:hypothetical protein